MNIDSFNYENKKKMNALYEKYGSNPVIKHLTNMQKTIYKDDVAMWNQINHIERSLMESGILSTAPTPYPDTVEQAAKEGNVMFYQTVPNSHFWTDIEMLIRFLNYQIRTQNTPDIIDYIIMGLENTLKNGYQISKWQQEQGVGHEGGDLPSIAEILSTPREDEIINERLPINKQYVTTYGYDYPRQKNRYDLMSPGERAITDAVLEIEKIGAHEQLTNIVIFLDNVRGMLYNYYMNYHKENKNKSQSPPLSATGQDASGFFTGELQARTDRILRDSGSSSKEVYDAINAVMNDLKNEFLITKKG